MWGIYGIIVPCQNLSRIIVWTLLQIFKEIESSTIWCLITVGFLFLARGLCECLKLKKSFSTKFSSRAIHHDIEQPHKYNLPYLRHCFGSKNHCLMFCHDAITCWFWSQLIHFNNYNLNITTIWLCKEIN